MEMIPADIKGSVLDVATGLSGFRLIHDWPRDYPKLILTDNLNFITGKNEIDYSIKNAFLSDSFYDDLDVE